MAVLGRAPKEGDRITHDILHQLHSTTWKDVFERLAQGIDACERVAHVLEGIVVKQS